MSNDTLYTIWALTKQADNKIRSSNTKIRKHTHYDMHNSDK